MDAVMLAWFAIFENDTSVGNGCIAHLRMPTLYRLSSKTRPVITPFGITERYGLRSPKNTISRLPANCAGFGLSGSERFRFIVGELMFCVIPAPLATGEFVTFEP